jgi:hypothetical protein
MDSDRQLRAVVVGALEEVTPPAPWLVSTIGESLRGHPRRGGRKMVAAAKFTNRGLSVAVAVALVLVIGAAAVGIFALRSIGHPTSAHPGQSAAVRYAQLLQRDQQLLNQAVGHEVVVGYVGNYCDSLAHTECPGTLGQVVGAYQRLLDDLGRTTPPAQFASEHGRLRSDLPALIAEVNLGAAAFKAGDIATSNRDLQAGLVLRDEILTIEDYVIYESTGDRPARDAATAEYASVIARDYDQLQLPALVSGLLACKAADNQCSTSVATTRAATQAFLADLQARTPPTHFLEVHGLLVTGVQTELQSLSEIDSALASRDEVALDVAKQNAFKAQGRLTTYTGAILYAR